VWCAFERYGRFQEQAHGRSYAFKTKQIDTPSYAKKKTTNILVSK
jgi:hypothetical protein